MNCYLHPDREAVGACTSCGRLICSEDALEMQGKLVCRECLSTGRATLRSQSTRDPNTAYIIELVGGFFGLLGLGYFYVGRTNDGIIRLISWIIYDVIAAITISLLLAVVIGIVCIPFQLIIQIGVPIWSATVLKNQLLAQPTPAVPVVRPMIPVLTSKPVTIPETSQVPFESDSSTTEEASEKVISTEHAKPKDENSENSLS